MARGVCALQSSSIIMARFYITSIVTGINLNHPYSAEGEKFTRVNPLILMQFLIIYLPHYQTLRILHQLYRCKSSLELL